MSELEDIGSLPAEKALTLAQPGWARAALWTFVVLGGIYILNPTFGVDLLPDNMPILGNLDEAAVLVLMMGALRYLGVRLPDFIERMLQPAPRLPFNVPEVIEGEGS